MNIKFKISKVSRKKYYLSILYINENFLKYIEGKVVHIDFKTKKIRYENSWNPSYVNNSKFTIFFHKDHNTMLDIFGSNQIFRIFSSSKGSKFECNIEDFDKLLIKALKALSDAYNNKNDY